jgi:hypothetical protein
MYQILPSYHIANHLDMRYHLGKLIYLFHGAFPDACHLYKWGKLSLADSCSLFMGLACSVNLASS